MIKGILGLNLIILVLNILTTLGVNGDKITFVTVQIIFNLLIFGSFLLY